MQVITTESRVGRITTSLQACPSDIYIYTQHRSSLIIPRSVQAFHRRLSVIPDLILHSLNAIDCASDRKASSQREGEGIHSQLEIIWQPS